MNPIVFAFTSREDWEFSYAFQDANGNPVDMTGRDYKIEIYSPSTNAVIATLKTNDATLRITGASKNEISGRLDNSITSAFGVNKVYGADLSWTSTEEDHVVVTAKVNHVQPGNLRNGDYPGTVTVSVDPDTLDSPAFVAVTLSGPQGPRGVSLRGPMVVAARGMVLGEGTTKLGGAPNNYTRGETRFKGYVGRSAVSGIRLVFTNWGVGASGSGEYVGDNNITIEAGLETNESPFFVEQVTFGGQNTITIPPGGTAISDICGQNFAAGATFWVRTGVTVTSTQTWPGGLYPYVSGENAVASTSATSQIQTAGALTIPPGGATTGYSFGPVAIIGNPQTKTPSVVIIGDSIARGNGDSTGIITAPGWVCRGLENVSGFKIPWMNLSRTSDTLLANTAQYGNRKRKLFEYANTAIIEAGGNDTSATVDVIKTRYAEVIAALRSRANIERVVVATWPPRTTSTDSWATPANQTPVANFEIGGKRDQINEWIRTTLCDGLVDAYLDPALYVEDPANPGKLLTNGSANYLTSDGVHLNAAGSILAAQCLPAIAATWT